MKPCLVSVNILTIFCALTFRPFYECDQTKYISVPRKVYVPNCSGWFWNVKGCHRTQFTKYPNGTECVCCNGYSGSACGNCQPTCDLKCRNDGTCVAKLDTNSVQQRCKCPVEFSGRLCDYRHPLGLKPPSSVCMVHTSVDYVSGKVVSYNRRASGTYYHDGIDCSLVLSIPPESSGNERSIFLTVTKLDLEKSSDCSRDYLEILGCPLTPRSSTCVHQSLKRLCGNDAVTNFDTKSNRVKLVFHTDDSYAGTGFNVDYQYISRKSQSECWHTKYRQERYRESCGWFIPKQCDRVRKIVDGLECRCCNGFGGACGVCEPLCFRNSSFQGGVMLQSASYGKSKYAPGLSCPFSVEAPVGKILKISFQFMDIEATDLCYADYVSIEDGGTPSLLLGRFCGSLIPRDVIYSATNSATVKFVTNDKNEHTGFRMRIEFVSPKQIPCIAVIRKGITDGSVLTGSYLQSAEANYSSNLKCVYNLNVLKNMQIDLRFNEFHTEENCLDRLSIYDYRQQKWTRSLCGRLADLPHGGRVESAGNMMHFYFETNQAIERRGWKADFTSFFQKPDMLDFYIVEVSTITRVVTSGNIPTGFLYNPNLNVSKVFVAESSDFYFRVSFIMLDIEYSSGCTKDKLELTDDQTLLGQFCGTRKPASSIVTPRNKLTLTFVTDQYENLNGFKIQVDKLQKATSVEDCFLNTTSSNQVALGSTSLEQGLYQPHMSCELFLTAPVGHFVQVTFDFIDIEYDSNRCSLDSLIFYDNDRQWRRFCGRETPPTMTSVSRNVKLKFSSNRLIERSGFKLQYSFVRNDFRCWNFISVTNTTGTLSLGNKAEGRDTYWPNMKSCMLVITAPDGYNVRFTISKLAIESSTGCKKDSLKIYDGSSRSARLIGSYCGKVPPATIVSSENSLSVDFSSDDSIEGVGFSASYVFVQTIVNSCRKEDCFMKYNDFEFATSNYACTDRDTYWERMDCTASITAPTDKVVEVVFVEFDLEFNSRCQYDFVSFIEISSSGAETMLAKYCGSTKPPKYTSSSSKLKIRFYSDYSVQKKGFHVKFSFIDPPPVVVIDPGDVKCGVPKVGSNERIVGGEEVARGSYPWQVSLRRFSRHICGATLIKDLWVLTAAHCLPGSQPSDITLVFGAHTIYSEGHEQSIGATTLIVHPGYNSNTNANDIALIKLTTSVKYTDLVIPACLPSSSAIAADPCFVSGWGRTREGDSSSIASRLQAVDVSLVSNMKCDAAYGWLTIFDTMLCGGSAGKDSCQGDSGGPLACRTGNGVWTVHGVVSFGVGCGRAAYPGVYARVSKYIPWIQNEIQRNE